MRHTNFFLFVFALLVLTSCSKEDEQNNSIVGTWMFVTIEAMGCDDPNDNGITDIAALSCDKDPLNCQELSYIFREDGTFGIEGKSVIDGISSTELLEGGTYTYANSLLKTCIGNNEPCEEFPWTVEGNNSQGTDFDTDLAGCTGIVSLIRL